MSRGIAVGRSIRQIAQGLGQGAVGQITGRLGATAAVRPIVQTGLIGVPGSGRCAPSLAVWRCTGSYDGRVGAQRARVGMVAAADLRLAEAGVPNPPRHADISQKAIYRAASLIQTRGVLKKELTAQLRTARRMRRPKSHNAKSGQGHILDMA